MFWGLSLLENDKKGHFAGQPDCQAHLPAVRILHVSVPNGALLKDVRETEKELGRTGLDGKRKRLDETFYLLFYF